MKSKLIALSMALLVLAGSSMTAQAAICPHPNAPGGVHYYVTDHIHCHDEGMGYTKDLGTHRYLYAEYDTGEKIYHDDCRITQTHSYHRYMCYWCGQVDTSASHEHIHEVKHSIAHN